MGVAIVWEAIRGESVPDQLLVHGLEATLVQAAIFFKVVASLMLLNISREQVVSRDKGHHECDSPVDPRHFNRHFLFCLFN